MLKKQLDANKFGKLNDKNKLFQRYLSPKQTEKI